MINLTRNELIKKQENLQEYHDAGINGTGEEALNVELGNGSHAKYVDETLLFRSPNVKIHNLQAKSYELDLVLKYLKENPQINWVNMSYGASYSNYQFTIFKEIMDEICDSVIAVTMSSGNEEFPSGILRDNKLLDERMIIVGAAEPDLDSASYSSYDDKGTVDCLSIVGITMQDGMYFGGTSEAAPGMLGKLILRKQSNDLNELVEDADIMVDALTIDIGEYGKDDKTGKGIAVMPRLNGRQDSVQMYNLENDPVSVRRDETARRIDEGWTLVE